MPLLLDFRPALSLLLENTMIRQSTTYAQNAISPRLIRFGLRLTSKGQNLVSILCCVGYRIRCRCEGNLIGLPIFASLFFCAVRSTASDEPACKRLCLKPKTGRIGLFMAALVIFLQETSGDSDSHAGEERRTWASSIKQLQLANRAICKDCRELVPFRLRVFVNRRVWDTENELCGGVGDSFCISLPAEKCVFYIGCVPRSLSTISRQYHPWRVFAPNPAFEATKRVFNTADFFSQIS